MLKLNGILIGLACGTLAAASSANATLLDLQDTPLFLKETQAAPLTMLTMGRNHKLYYEAYNDAADLDDDGDLDVGYNPGEIDYFGYFDSYKCYDYDGSKFVPQVATTDKTCSGMWSGDFLNYVTTARIDALRKVLYGGKRVVDSTSETVLERSFIPQDAHSWGKEYTSVDVDGYDISDYTPLPLPFDGKRHLFANTTLYSESDPPFMRVLNDTSFRVWEWLSIERPVADSQCGNPTKTSCAVGASAADWQIVPASDGTTFGLQNLETTVYDMTGSSIRFPNSHAEWNTLLATYAIPAQECGQVFPTVIDQYGNPVNGSAPCNGSSDYYIALTKGELVVPAGGGTFDFGVNGDDSLELLINGVVVAHWYGGHGRGNPADHQGSITLSEGVHTIEYRMNEWGGGDSYSLYYNLGATPSSYIEDYVVQVEVCVAGLLEEDCREYEDSLGNITYKPTGILHDFGEDETMWFGLITGSYDKNLSGGVLRKNMGTFADEINPETGQYDTGVDGIVQTLDSLRIAEFQYSNKTYEDGWITTRVINEGETEDWGNPIAEMMYEGLRYFSGAGAPRSEFNIASSGNEDAALGLPLPAWEDPYDPTTGASECAKPFQLVISDINPSYDSDLLPGVDANFGSGIVPDGGSVFEALDVSSLANTITANEDGIAGNRFIGQSAADYDGSPTAKTVTSLGDIRGLSPEEPTKEGSYYSASVAYFGLTTDLHDVDDEQKVDTFAVALASPLPRIEIPTRDGTQVTMVPFAKSVGGCLGVNGTEGVFQPTNTIVDFYVESIDAESGAFRINYEDVEQGADHDMDMIVRYEYELLDDGTIDVTLDSTYAAGCIQQHAGYVISGTTTDGIYLEVRDLDTGSGSDPDYYLDTPPGVLPGEDNADGVALPLSTTRNFTPGSTTGATLLKDPLWYAAKWGGFIDANDNQMPDLDEEWDEDGDGDPDNYFLVTNALGLKDELSRTFLEILSRVGSASGISLATGVIRQGGTTAFGTGFDSSNWSGAVDAIVVNEQGEFELVDGELQTVWEAAAILDARTYTSRVLVTSFDNGDSFVEYDWTNFPTDLADKYNDTDMLGEERAMYIQGDRSMEVINGGPFRERGSVLGAVIHSEAHPVFNPREQYSEERSFPDGPEDDYATFREDNKGRDGMIYVGGNDGFMHVFDAETGEEMWAYAPSVVHDPLIDYTTPTWNYESFVDLTPTTRDIYRVEAGSGWQTLLVGGMRHGGQLYYGIDVTTPPSSPTASAMASTIAWEFSDYDDPDMGYSYGEPYVARIQGSSTTSSNWAVFVGNGYNSTEPDSYVGSGNAVLFVINAETGDLIAKIDTDPGGLLIDPLGSGRPNGLGAPTVVDWDSDDIGDAVYAGDLYGNVWEFDISSVNPADWRVSNGGLPFFHASSDGLPADSTTYQPVIARPRVEFTNYGNSSSDRNDLVVLFGTGKYIEQGDQTVSIPTQTFYGLVDRNRSCDLFSCAISRGDLLPRTLTTTTLGDNTVRGLTDPADEDFWFSTNDRMDWATFPGWYIDLTAGERVVSNAQFRGNLVLFPTLIPNTDNPCEPGGTSFLMVVDFRSGGPAGTGPDDPEIVNPAIDFNGDGKINSDDLLSGGDMAVGLQFDDVVVGVTSTVVRGVGDDTILITTAGNEEGSCEGGVCQPKATGVEYHRRSWRQRHNFD